jgi:hypothetical protein
MRFGACLDDQRHLGRETPDIGSEARGRQMDPIAMLIVALAVILAMNVLGDAPRTDRRSHN